MATGNQNAKPSNLMAIGLPAAVTDVLTMSVQSNVSAAGTTLATATATVADIVYVCSTGASAGITLRKGDGFRRRQTVINGGANSLTVYPPILGGCIGNAASATVLSGASAMFQSVDPSGNQYWKL